MRFMLVVVWSVLGGCIVDSAGLSTADTAGDGMLALMPAAPDTAPASEDTAPSIDAVMAAAPDAGAEALPVDTTPDVLPLLGLGARCEVGTVCASGYCSGGYRVCAERACGPCETGTREGLCVHLDDGSACRGMRASCERVSERGAPCVFTQHVCKAGACEVTELNCCERGLACSATYGCRSQ